MTDSPLEHRTLGDRYLIERELGRGGMAAVYLARDLRHDRQVAVKVLQADLAAMIGPERFLREIRTIAGLRHPNIVPLYDSGETEGLLYYVMPCVTEKSLRYRLEQEHQLPLDEAIRITREVGEALDFAHGQGIVHRDVKPENIMFESGHAVLCDFGIARAIGRAGGDRLTSTGLAIGTPPYMSPEQVLGEPVDGRSDVYALGCVLYEMLAGAPPHAAPNPQAVLARRLTEVPRSLRADRPNIPPAVDAAVSRALARIPADRFRTAAEFVAALTAAEPGPAAKADSPAGRPARRPRWLVPVAAAGVLATATILWALLRGPRGAVEGEVASRLVVFPFTVRTAGAHAYLGEGVVDLLSRNLDGIEGLRTVEPGTVLTALGRDPAGSTDLERGRAVARRLGAGLFILGSVYGAAGRLRIQAEVYGGAHNDPLARAAVEGDSGDVFGLVDRLAGELLVATRGGATHRLAETAALTTRSLPALKEYLNAEAALRVGDTASAFAGFQRAIAADSAFALAFYRLAIASGWYDRQDAAGWATARALALRGRLAERDRRLLEAYGAFRRGAADHAEREYRAILRDYPDDLEAQFQLADVLYHFNPLRGRPIGEARELFDQVLANDPGFL